MYSCKMCRIKCIFGCSSRVKRRHVCGNERSRIHQRLVHYLGSCEWVFASMHMCAAVMCVSGQRWLTADGEHIVLDLCSDLDAAPPLSVVSPTQTRHVGHTALMDVHHAVWMEGDRKRDMLNHNPNLQMHCVQDDTWIYIYKCDLLKIRRKGKVLSFYQRPVEPIL